jgi:hypothetical protein
LSENENTFLIHPGSAPRGEHDEAGPERGHDLALEAVGEIGRVEEIVGVRRERVAFLGAADALLGQVRAGEPGLGHGVTLALEHRAEMVHVRRAAHPVGALDDDEPAGEVAGVDARDAAPVRLEAPHGATARS